MFLSLKTLAIYICIIFCLIYSSQALKCYSCSGTTDLASCTSTVTCPNSTIFTYSCYVTKKFELIEFFFIIFLMDIYKIENIIEILYNYNLCQRLQLFMLCRLHYKYSRHSTDKLLFSWPLQLSWKFNEVQWYHHCCWILFSLSFDLFMRKLNQNWISLK